MNRSWIPWACLALVALVGTSSAASAQSVYVVDGTAMTFSELTGPPDPANCSYPNGPTISSFSYNVAGPCLPPGNFPQPPASFIGDIAVDRVNDEVYVTDGLTIGVYKAPTGTMINAMPGTGLGVGPLTGMGFDSALGVLWVTDGLMIGGVVPSPPGSCALPLPVGPPFVPLFPFGFITDVEWDAFGGLIWVCDSNGQVAAMFPGGAPMLPPYLAGKWCGLSSQLTGLAIDTAALPVALGPQLYVSDGFQIAYEPAGGVAPPFPTFYTPAPCYGVPGGPTQGLAFAARPITYGAAFDPSGLTPPNFTTWGQSVLPNPTFTLMLNGAVPAGRAWLVVGLGSACPPLNFKGNPWYVLPFNLFVGPFTVDAFGNVTLPAPLGPPSPAFPPSLSIYMQWVVQAPNGVWQTTEGLEMTLAIP
jgi:hypothetical protein